MFNRFVLLLIWFRLNVIKSKRLQTQGVDPIIELNYKPLKQTQSKVYISVLSLVSATRVHVHELDKKLSLAIDNPWVYHKVTVT